MATTQDAEAIVESMQHLVRTEDVHARGGQLDSQRDPIQTLTDLRHWPGVQVGQREARQRRTRPITEQANRRGRADLVVACQAGAGKRQWRHTPDGLTLDPKRWPTRGQDAPLGPLPHKSSNRGKT